MYITFVFLLSVKIDNYRENTAFLELVAMLSDVYKWPTFILLLSVLDLLLQKSFSESIVVVIITQSY